MQFIKKTLAFLQYFCLFLGLTLMTGWAYKQVPWLVLLLLMTATIYLISKDFKEPTV